MISVDVIKTELEKSEGVMREAEQRIGQYRQALEQLTAVLLKASGKAEGYKELLRQAEESEAAERAKGGAGNGVLSEAEMDALATISKDRSVGLGDTAGDVS